MADARLSDRELAAINVAAVTKEYRVQPHLGLSIHLLPEDVSKLVVQTIGLFLLSVGNYRSLLGMMIATKLMD